MMIGTKGLLLRDHQLKTTDVRTSPVATQLSPSLLDSSLQNINKRTNGHVPDYVSRERSHSNDSRASAKNNQGKCDQPKSIKPQMPEQPRVFKSPVRLARSRNTSNNVNSANNKSKTENNSKKTTQGICVTTMVIVTVCGSHAHGQV